MALHLTMKRHVRQSSRSSRAALLLAFLCFWMATVGLAHHTDLLSDGGSSSARTVLGHPLSLISPTDLCAACQWTQMVQPGGIFLPVVAVSLDGRPAQALTAFDVLLPSALCSSSPRAPPLSPLPKQPASFV